MIVVDIGCADHGEDRSLGPLRDRFAPDLLFGFDPLADAHVDGATIVVPVAAWLFDGTVGFVTDGIRSKVDAGASTVRCFDLDLFLRSLPADASLVVKLDAEGAEYPLLERLHETGTDRRIERLLVEWHSEEQVSVDCPVEEWHQVGVAA